VQGPQVIEPWKYSIPGPIRGTPQVLSEETAKETYAGYLRDNCPNCCDPGSLIGQGDWQETSASGWGADYPNGYEKSLVYRVVPRISPTQCGTPSTISTTVRKYRYLGCDLGIH